MREQSASKRGLVLDTADFIVVGAGAAGCLLANRLSASGEHSVLLLEAGGVDWNPLIRVPMLAGLLYTMKSLNWGYETMPQTGLGGRSVRWPRGRVLGGSTAINGLMYVRGDREDYDSWRASGLAGWGYEDVLPHFRAFERNLSHADKAFHGHAGELWTQKAKGLNPLYAAWLDSAGAAGFSANEDFNGERQEGVGFFDFNLHGGRRVSAADAFLDPIRSRRNLHVRTRTHVTRLRFDGRRCIGVDTDRGQLSAAREVILAAGAINSPQILETSGIGDPALLRTLGIQVIMEASSVGENLHDHLGITVQHDCLTPVTLFGLMRPDRAIGAGLRNLLTGGGPAAAVPLEAGGFLKTRPEFDRPDVHVILVPGLSLAATRGGQSRHGFTTSVYQLRPLSRGHTHIVSADPRAKPRIDPNYLAESRDGRVLRDGVALARRIAGQSPLSRYRGDEISPGASLSNEEDIGAWVAQNATTVFHPVGTCRMGVDEHAVVDAQLRVKGVQGLRIADASVMPSIISGNTSAPTMMIAEKTAAFILGTIQASAEIKR